MQEEKKVGLWAKIGAFGLKNPIASLFALVIAYYAAKIYIFGGDTFTNRAILYALFVAWGVYFVVRHLFKVLLALIILGGIGYGIYAYYSYCNNRGCGNKVKIDAAFAGKINIKHHSGCRRERNENKGAKSGRMSFA